MTRAMRGAAGESRVFADLSHADDLQDVIERLGQAIGNPVTVESPRFELIAYTRHAGDMDQARQRTILRKQVPDTLVRALHERGVVRKLNDASRAIRVAAIPDEDLGERVAMPVRISGELRAVIWVPETFRRLNEDDLSLLEHAAALCAVWLLRADQQRETRARLQGDFLWDLLESPHGDEQAIAERARGLAVELPARFSIVVTDLDDFQARVARETPNELHIDKIKREVLRIAREAAAKFDLCLLAASRSDSLNLLVGPAPSRGIGAVSPGAFSVEPFLRSVRDGAAEQGVPLSIVASGTADTWSSLPALHRLAQDCLKAGRLLGGERFAMTTADFGVLAKLGGMAELVTDGIAGGVHGKVRRMLAEETERALAFPILETLETYLDLACDSRRAAERLHLHVNTLNYRIRKIAERSGLDLSNGLERLAIHLELKLRRAGHR